MKILNFLQEKVLTSIGVVLFSISCLWMLIEALSRQIFNKSFAISEELVVFSLVWAIFLTLGQSGRENNHVRVDLIVRKFKPQYLKIVNLMSYIIGLLYSIILIYMSFGYIEHLLSTGITSHSPLQLPMALVVLIIPVGMSFFGLFYVEAFIKEIKNKNAL